MKLLLDTCTFLWLLQESRDLSLHAKELFQDPMSEVYLSAVSAWEISLKYRLGSLDLSEPPERLVPEQRKRLGIEFLAIDEMAATRIHLLPDFHKDPFDRMLVSQGIVHGLTILTPDEQIRRYPVMTEW